MTRDDAFPDLDKAMRERDDAGMDQQGGPTGIPWTKPEPEPEGPKELDEKTLANIRRAFQ